MDSKGLKKSKLKFIGIATLASACIVSSELVHSADLSPEEGLKKLSQNIEVSTKNRDEYNKAIEQISHNVIALDSASVELNASKKKLQQQITENKNTLSLHTKKMQDIDRNKQEEERKKQADLQKIQQLEKTLAQLKALQLTRQDRIDKLALDRASIEKSKKEGEELQQTLAQETKTIDQRIDTLKKEMAPWKSKRKSYEKEVSRWNNEIDRHQKMETEVKLLIDETT